MIPDAILPIYDLWGGAKAPPDPRFPICLKPEPARKKTQISENVFILMKIRQNVVKIN